MLITLFPGGAPERLSKQVAAIIEGLGIDVKIYRNEAGEMEGDVVVVLGGDRGVLQALHAAGPSCPPILGVQEAGSSSFLAEVALEGLEPVLKRFIKGEHAIQAATKLDIRVDGRAWDFALNEVAVFPSKSASLLEYALSVDGEAVWRDYSDGVIICTPTGSTAYAMSAGGPLVLSRSPVFVVVPVNSLDVTRRPLVVPDASTVRIGEVASRYTCEAIMDGTRRLRVSDAVEVAKSKEAARFLRFPDSASAMRIMAKKVRFAEELQGMPPSAKLTLKILQYEGPLTPRELSKKTLLPERTVRLAISLLVDRGFVRRQNLLRDARQKLYHAVEGLSLTSP